MKHTANKSSNSEAKKQNEFEAIQAKFLQSDKGEEATLTFYKEISEKYKPFEALTEVERPSFEYNAGKALLVVMANQNKDIGTLGSAERHIYDGMRTHLQSLIINCKTAAEQKPEHELKAETE
jgi:hypothetical protein